MDEPKSLYDKIKITLFSAKDAIKPYINRHNALTFAKATAISSAGYLLWWIGTHHLSDTIVLHRVGTQLNEARQAFDAYLSCYPRTAQGDMNTINWLQLQVIQISNSLPSFTPGSLVDKMHFMLDGCQEQLYLWNTGGLDPAARALDFCVEQFYGTPKEIIFNIGKAIVESSVGAYLLFFKGPTKLREIRVEEPDFNMDDDLLRSDITWPEDPFYMFTIEDNVTNGLGYNPLPHTYFKQQWIGDAEQDLQWHLGLMDLKVQNAEYQREVRIRNHFQQIDS